MIRALAACVAVAFAASAALADSAAHFDYLYVRAHEGTASGGHAAIRIGDAVYDFQHDAGRIAPRRESARRFQHVYRALENRSIERTRIAASPETVALLRDAFERRLVAQARQLALADELASDAALLDALTEGSLVEVPVRGAAFFARAPAPAAALVELRERIAAAHGPAHLARRVADAETALRDAALDPPDLAAIAVEPDAFPAVAPTLARRFAYALAARRVAEILAAPHRLVPSMLADAPGAPLDSFTEERLRDARDAIFERAVQLAASRRPDWGEAFLLAAARLAALDASLASGTLRTLDAIAPDARRLSVTPRRRALVPVLLAEAQGEFAGALDRFRSAPSFDELAFADLEAAAARVAALRAAAAGAPELRVAAGAIAPEGIAAIPLEPRPRADRAALERAHAATARASAAYRARLDRRYGYDLVRRNCVTELFRTIDAAFAADGRSADSDAAVRAESERRLGGHVGAQSGGAFVPFLSDLRVRTTWRVVERAHLVSAREHVVARDGSLAAHLRESNVFTATSHRPGDGAAFFVFFTEGSPVLRPLLGALNLSAALLRAGFGVATLPSDGGRGVRAGLDGAFWSVPELVFANVRKGTNEWLPPELRPPAD